MKFSFLLIVLFSLRLLSTPVLADQKLFLIQKEEGEITVIKQGFLVGERFVQDGVCWSYNKIRFNESVTRSFYKNGSKVGASQSFSSGAFKKPLEYIIGKIGSEAIESDAFADSYWKLIKNPTPEDNQ